MRRVPEALLPRGLLLARARAQVLAGQVLPPKVRLQPPVLWAGCRLDSEPLG